MSRNDDERVSRLDGRRDRGIVEWHIECGGEAEGIDPLVPGHEHLLVRNALSDEALLVRRRGRQMERSDPRDQLAIQLLWERRQRRPCTQPGLDVYDRDAQVEAGKCGCERRLRIAVNNRSGRKPSMDLNSRRSRSAGRPEALPAERVQTVNRR